MYIPKLRTITSGSVVAARSAASQDRSNSSSQANVLSR